MGLELEAWYGSSWQQPPDSQRFLDQARSEFASQETLATWRSRADALATPKVSVREGGALVLGRFYPPHLGHAFLLQVAERSIKGPLHVYVVGRDDDHGMGVNWRREFVERLLRRHDSTAKVAVPIPGSPQQPEFWQAWADWLRSQNLPAEIRTLFASDPQAQQLASLLKLDFVLVDPERRTVPISATMIRKAPWEHWDFIHPDVRRYFAMGVVLLGPEGAGKTTLSQTLASHYATSRVPEFAAYWVSKHLGKIPDRNDFGDLAEGQFQLLANVGSQTRRFFVADTDLISLQLWEQRLYGSKDMVTAKILGDLYLVLDDAPWKGPAHRDEPAARTAFVQSCLEAVRAQHRTPILISGPRESRAVAAIERIDAWVRTNPAAWER